MFLFFRFLLPLLFLTHFLYADEMTSNKQKSLEAIKELGSSLKSSLQMVMKESGPIAALEYCNVAAQDITKELSDTLQLKVRRTSLKTRNKNNYDINFGGIQMKISSNFDLKDSVSIALRPETIEIIKEKTNNCMAAKIINASYVGNCYQYVVSSSVGELFIVSNETVNHFKLNEEVFITFDESGITILED